MAEQEVVVTFREEISFLAEVDAAAMKVGVVRSEYIRNALRKEVWGPLASLVELRRDLQEELARIQDSIQKNSEAILASAKEAKS